MPGRHRQQSRSGAARSRPGCNAHGRAAAAESTSPRGLRRWYHAWSAAPWTRRFHLSLRGGAPSPNAAMAAVAELVVAPMSGASGGPRRRRGSPRRTRGARRTGMTLEIRRLHLASLRGPDGGEWPVHGFVVLRPGGAALVNTGVGEPDDLLSDWRVVQPQRRRCAGRPRDESRRHRPGHQHAPALRSLPPERGLPARRGLHPAGRRPARSARSRSCTTGSASWNPSFELLRRGRRDPAGRVHHHAAARGHQSVVVRTGDGSADLLTGDAAYTPRQYRQPPAPDSAACRMGGPRTSPPAPQDSLARMHALSAGRSTSATTPTSCTADGPPRASSPAHIRNT